MKWIWINLLKFKFGLIAAHEWSRRQTRWIRANQSINLINIPVAVKSMNFKLMTPSVLKWIELTKPELMDWLDWMKRELYKITVILNMYRQ